MRKVINTLLICLILLSFPQKVYAKTKIGSCVYIPEIKEYDLYKNKFTLKVTLYKDGTTDREISLGKAKWKNTEIKTGLLLGDTPVYLQYSKMFNKDGAFYQEYKKNKNCPQMNFIMNSNTNQLRFYVGNSTIDAEGYSNDSIKPKMTDINTNSGEEIEEETIYCKRKIRIKSLGDTVTVTFKKSGDQKIFEIDEKERGKFSATAKEIVQGSTCTYRIKEVDIENYFNKNTCGNTPLYAHAITGDSAYIEFQSEAPDEVENGSVSPGGSTSEEWLEKIEDIPTKEECEANPDKKGCAKNRCEIVDTNGEIYKILKQVIGYLQIGSVFAVLVLCILDFGGAIASSDDDAFRKARGKVMKRIIALVLIFLVPLLVNFVINLVNLGACSEEDYDFIGNLFN